MADEPIQISYNSDKTDSPSNDTTQDFVNSSFLQSYKIKQHITTAPTYIPKNFFDQIAFFDDGSSQKLYFYVNNAWKSVSASSGGGSHAVGYTTASGTTQAITGIGFKPSLVKISAFNTYSQSFGLYTADTGDFCSFRWQRISTMEVKCDQAIGNIVTTVDATGTYTGQAHINSLDNDGFTLHWTTNTGTNYLHYECYA